MLFIFIIMGCNDEDSVSLAEVGMAGVEGSGGATRAGTSVATGTGGAAGAGEAVRTGEAGEAAGFAGVAGTDGAGGMVGFGGEIVAGGEAGADMVGLPDGNNRLKSLIFGISFYEREIPPMDGTGKVFLMMETEVTQELYEAVMGVNPSSFTSPYNPQRPVEQVSWVDGLRFANALSVAMGLEPAYDGDDNNAQLIDEASELHTQLWHRQRDEHIGPQRRFPCRAELDVPPGGNVDRAER